jgi:hypothetical protein
MVSAAKWIGTITGIVGALLIAANIGAVVWGFALFLVSSTLWTTVAVIQRERSLWLLQGVYVGLNVLGIIRWL